MDELNTIETFMNEGFKIMRDGQVIILTEDEKFDLLYLQQAVKGRECVDNYSFFYGETEEDKQICEDIMSDEEWCFNIESRIMDLLADDIVYAEREVLTDIWDNWKQRHKAEQ